jgi:capsular polysaccharide biosynthesis protein
MKLALGLGLILALGFGFLREIIDPRVRSVVDIEKSLGVPLLATVSGIDTRRRPRAALR